MKRITLKNIEDIESLRDYKPESFEDIATKQAALESLNDSGVLNFKEVTNLNQISFGHFILLEKILTLDIEQDKKTEMLMPVLLRPFDEEKIDNEDQEKEAKHKEDVFHINIGSVYGALNRFMEIRKEYLFKTYNGVIYGTLEEDEEDEVEDEGTHIDSSQSARAFHNEKFFWFDLVHEVSGKDLFKHKDAVELMMYEVMPFLAEKRSREIVEFLEHKASMQ